LIGHRADQLWRSDDES